MNDMDTMLARSTPIRSSMDHSGNLLKKACDDSDADFEKFFKSKNSTRRHNDISNLSHQALHLSLEDDASDDEEERSVSSFYIPGITQKARCLSPSDNSTSKTSRRAESRRNAIKKRMMSANELTSRDRSSASLEEFPDNAERQQLKNGPSSSMSKIDTSSRRRRHSNNNNDDDSTSSRSSENAKYLDDLKSEMDRLARKQKKLLRKQKKALRELKKL